MPKTILTFFRHGVYIVFTTLARSQYVLTSIDGEYGCIKPM